MTKDQKVSTEKWEEDIVEYLGEDQHGECDEECSKKYYEEKNKQDLVDDVKLLLKQKEKETLEMVREQFVTTRPPYPNGEHVSKDKFYKYINNKIKELER